MVPRPLGVSILGFLLLLLGVGFLLLAVLLVSPASLWSGGLTYLAGVSASFLLKGPGSIVMVEGALGFGFLFVLLGVGLWRGINIARVLFMLIQVLQALITFLFVATAPMVSVVGVTVSLMVVAYLHVPQIRLYFE